MGKYISLIKSQKVYFIFINCFFVIGIIFGLFFHTQVEQDQIILSTINYYQKIYSVDTSTFLLALYKLLTNLVIYTIVVATSFVSFLIPIHFVIVFYKGFILGVVFLAFIAKIGFTGVILFVFCVLVSEIIFILSLTIYSTLSLTVESKNIYDYFDYIIFGGIIMLISIIYYFLVLSLIFRPLYFCF